MKRRRGRALQAKGGAVTERELTVSFPGMGAARSIAVVADVTWNGRRLGEIAEAVGVMVR